MPPSAPIFDCINRVQHLNGSVLRWFVRIGDAIIWGDSRKTRSAALQAHLDAKARERQHDVIQTAITYRGAPNPQFSAKGEALFAW
ncbi:hypothetical protein GOA58_30790 [Sinorhizobium meliloti]|nr:hypothetical protein [Sinorhizobium meliloti]MDW9664953.1 hypothetical protein [Sinorhizobium meliloti]MDX0054760.1 hypothetical protein [Sinorhizobium meliloti]